MRDENRTEQIGIRLTPDERASLEAAAEREQRTLADWSRLALLREAKRVRKVRKPSAA